MNTCTAAYIELKRISSICHFLSVDATKTLMCSLVLSKFDYCNSLLSGSPLYLIQLFQVQNTAARITLRAPRAERTSPLLCSLHWLPVQKRIKHKVCSICYTTLTGVNPQYMSELVNVYTPSRCLRSSSDSRTLTIPCVRSSVLLLIKSRTSYMEWRIIWAKTQRFIAHFQSALKTHQLT